MWTVNLNGSCRKLWCQDFVYWFFTQPNQAVVWRGPMAAKALNQMIFDADWESDFLLIDLPPELAIFTSVLYSPFPERGSGGQYPPNVALADAKRNRHVHTAEHRCSRFGHHRKYGYLPEELPNNKYYIFGEQGAENLAADKNVPSSVLCHWCKVSEKGWCGRPAALQQEHPYSNPSWESLRIWVTNYWKKYHFTTNQGGGHHQHGCVPVK